MSNGVAALNQDIKWLGLEAPRYTSYPSAHHFSAQVGEETHRQWLAAMDDKTTVSVYVHIPFCKELCWFCGCHTKMTKRYEPIAKYVRVLLKEIEVLKRYTQGKGKLVNIHFGGGSPSLLDPQDLLSILYAIASAFEFTPPGELAIELDPRTTTPENVEFYASLGVNRVSIGIQDFDPVVQQAINRVQSYSMVASVIDQFRNAGLTAINCDLIYGLPYQTPERFRDTLIKTLSLNPSRIALFSYAHVPQLKKHQRLIESAALPTEQEKLELYAMACELLEESGYVAIGIDHFAKADDAMTVALNNQSLRRNFQGYVATETDVLIGIGSSSISQFPQGYVQNSASAVDYRDRVERWALPSVRGWAFSGDDLARKRVIDELMCYMAVDLAVIRQQFGLPEHYFQPELESLLQTQYQSIVAIHGERVQMTTRQRMAARVIALQFDHYRNVASGRYSKVA